MTQPEKKNNKNIVSSNNSNVSNVSNVSNGDKEAKTEKEILTEWLKEQNIPSWWVEGLDTFEEIAMMYSEDQYGVFVKDCNITIREEKILAAKLFMKLKEYRKKSNGI